MPAAKRPPIPRAQIYWFGAMLIGGFAFGLIGERRPLGDDIFAHPLVLFFMTAIVGLLVMRAALARPVPEVIPERPLLLGCFAGLAAFLGGNWIAAHVLGG
jgi:drug/metabolite transporter (DMT)-like permease